jgi:hypothetical protein
MGVTTVSLIKDRHQRSVKNELKALLASAERGEIIGLGYAVVTDNRAVRQGLAGILASNRKEAAGILLQAAVGHAFKEIETN